MQDFERLHPRFFEPVISEQKLINLKGIMKKEIDKRIVEIGIIPVLNIKNPDHAVDLARAIVEGGIPIIEVTMREESSLQSLRNIRTAFPEMLVGAGTILRTEQVDAAIEAGADFLVAPGFNPTTIRYCRDRDIEIFPGAVTASEIEQGIELGLSIFKFFPIEQAGGLAMIDSFKGPFSNIRFIPTGGISLKNLHLYMADRATVDACDWAGVTKACQTAVNISLGFSLAHVGINHENAEQALATAKWFFDLFGFREGSDY